MNVLNDENSDHTKSTQLDQSAHMVYDKNFICPSKITVFDSNKI